jgi:hypothetical protein
MPQLRKQTQAIESELQSLELAAVDEAKYLQLAESLTGFRNKLRSRAETLEVRARQQVLRLLLKEVLIGSDTITLRHSIPVPQYGPRSDGSPIPSRPFLAAHKPDYLLRKGSQSGARLPNIRLRRGDHQQPTNNSIVVIYTGSSALGPRQLVCHLIRPRDPRIRASRSLVSSLPTTISIDE